MYTNYIFNDFYYIQLKYNYNYVELIAFMNYDHIYCKELPVTTGFLFVQTRAFTFLQT